MYKLTIISLAYLFCLNNSFGQTPFIDGHIHYNWDQAEVITPKQVIQRIKQQGISLAIAASTPSDLVLQLKAEADDLIIPFFSPYTHELGKQDWYKNQQTVELAKQGLADKRYQGIGEIHFMVGFPPRSDNAVFQQLMHLAEQYDVPAMIHVDAANEQFFLDICQTYPKVRIQFAHAGGNLFPEHIENVLLKCSNVWVDLAARDPWRYDGLTNANGFLQPKWRELILKHPQRFFVGTDPVWRVTRTQSWDQPDDGWDYYKQLYLYHNKWISVLPEKIQNRLRSQNVLDMLKMKKRN